MRSLNKARTASASLNVRRLRLAVIAIARLTLATMAADSGVLLGIILARSSFAIRYFPLGADGRRFGRFAEHGHRESYLSASLRRGAREERDGFRTGAG